MLVMKLDASCNLQLRLRVMGMDAGVGYGCLYILFDDSVRVNISNIITMVSSARAVASKVVVIPALSYL
jgi:hypothetical protein